jgi:hypothetical protein
MDRDGIAVLVEATEKNEAIAWAPHSIGSTAMKHASCVLLAALTVLAVHSGPMHIARAEPVAPSVHWGAIGYPDQERTLVTGLTLNRFTEFTQDGKQFGAVEESAGFNFATISWTERLRAWPGWNTNVTVGAGPTYPEPTGSIQNGFVHHLLGNGSIPIGRRREETDFMINGSVARWINLFGQPDAGFVSVGVASGSLYHEAFGRIGVRRLSPADVLQPVMGVSPALQAVSRYVRFSAMGQYGQVFGGAAYGNSVLAAQSWIGQASVSLAAYGNGAALPEWELEFAATIDSGLFATSTGRSIERRFGSLALRFPYGMVETWNDWLGGTDSGPTYGVQIMLDVRRIYRQVVGS